MWKTTSTAVPSLSTVQRLTMFDRIWPGLANEPFQEDDYSMLLAYIMSEKTMLERYPGLFAIDSIDRTVDIITVLRSMSSISRSVAIAIVKENFLTDSAEDDAILRSIELAVRTWLPLDIRFSGLHATSTAIRHRYISSIEWEEHVSLQELVESQFTKPKEAEIVTRTRIDPGLTMAHLVNVCGLRVFWTHNLTDHLSIDWRSRIVTVYEHKIALWNHLQYTTEPILPTEVLEEAIDTLNLFFPFTDAPTRAFLIKHGKTFDSLGYCTRPRTLELDKYRFWRKNIEDLTAIYNEPPRGLHQLKLDQDRRNLLQFATFWVATTVGILTVLSIVFGTVSTVYTIKQYELAVAQACMMDDAASKLARYCSRGS